MTAVIVEEGPDQGAIWHFGEPSKEQRALAEGNAWADLSHKSVITVSGEDRLSWLNDLTTQDLVNYAINTWTSALILNAQGHINHQLFLMDDGSTTWIFTEQKKEEELLTFLQKMVFMLRVEPKSATADYKVIKTKGKSDQFGGPYKIIKRNEAVREDCMQVGTWALEAERVAQQRARILFETDHKSIPNELNFLNNAVHMRKGCYPGQETVAKVFNLGQPPRRLVLLHLDGTEIDLPKHGDPIFRVDEPEKAIGFIGTVARHYEFGPIALGVIKRATPEDALLSAGGVRAAQDR
jgi:folate-binding protein YgfZ